MKKCSKCGEVKPVSEFNKRPSGRDGLRRECKTCLAAYKRKHYLENWQTIRAKHKVYYAEHREAVLATTKAYKERHREKYLAYGAAYRATRKHTQRAYGKIYRADNKKKIQAFLREWHRANPEKGRTAKLRRRALERGASGHATGEQIRARWDYYGGRCYICGTEAEATDHVKPLAMNGAGWPCNLRPICKACNSAKGAMWPFDIEGARSGH